MDIVKVNFTFYNISIMDELDIIKKAGLNEAQAKIYYTLMMNGALLPAKLAELSGESRENVYNILRKLEGMGVVVKTDDKKTTYRAANPSMLETLAENRRKVVAKNERVVKDGMSMLLNAFYANNEMPGSRTLEGIEGVKEVYLDVLRTKKDVYLLRTKADEIMNEYDGFLHKYRDQLPQLGIKTYALTPDGAMARRKMRNGRDKEVGFVRTLMPEDAYDIPVEIHVCGDKAAFISFGETQMATIIDSPTIAAAVKWMILTVTDFYKKNYPQKYTDF